MSFPPPAVLPHPGPPPELPEVPEGVAVRPRWPAWSAPVALVAGFGAAVFGFLIISVVAGIAGSEFEDPPPGVQIGGTVFQDLALIGSALLFARLWARPRAWHFGLRSPQWARAVGWTLLAWLAFLVFSAVYATVFNVDENDDLPSELGADDSTVALVAVAVLVCVLAPIAEEFFFRGFFFSALRGWRGPWVAAIITGLVFGGIHAGSASATLLPPLAAFGVVLCLLYWRTGSLYPCIALHALNNSLALGVTQGWGWEVPLLMVGSNLVIAAILHPFRARGGPVPRAV